MAAQRRRRVLPDPDPAGRSRRPFRRRDRAGGDALLQRARRRQVPAEPRGARRRLQGRADRRRVRRDPRRLRALPPRHAALQPRGPGPGGGRGAARGAAKRATRSRAACCCRTARRARSTASSGCSASSRPGSRRSPRRSRARCASCCSAGLHRRRSAGATAIARLLERPRRARPAGRPRPGAPVALPLGQDGAAQLHPDDARRPHGDGALGRGARAVPRPPRRRGDPVAAGRARRSAA